MVVSNVDRNRAIHIPTVSMCSRKPLRYSGSDSGSGSPACSTTPPTVKEASLFRRVFDTLFSICCCCCSWGCSCCFSPPPPPPPSIPTSSFSPIFSILTKKNHKTGKHEEKRSTNPISAARADVQSASKAPDVFLCWSYLTCRPVVANRTR